EFSEALSLPIAKVMQELMRAGILASLNEQIDFDTAAIIAEDLGFIAERKEGTEEDVADEGVDRLAEVLAAEDKKDLLDRPPVIVVMGHVDHGKTLLLDSIRSTNIVDTESGGITQHIGAYQVLRKGRDMTFIDTPGHEAFTVMRSRGAKVADMAILVVAADDGVQPQTREAIDIVKAAKLPFVVAINKIDKPEANLDKIRNQLSELGLISEEWGGDTVMVGVSAKTGENIDQLLDMLLLVADIEKAKIVANPKRRAIGTIIESHVDKGQGPVATVLVQTGSLSTGDVLGVRGVNYGRVRAMKTWDGQDTKKAAPSTPVRILGFKSAPSIGDILEVPVKAKDLQKLKAQPSRKVGVQEMTVRKTKAVQDGEEDSGDEQKVILNLIIRSDVLGSLEALLGMIEKIDNPHVGVKVVSKGLGTINESDVLSAEATDAMLIAFGVKPSSAASRLARDKNVDIHEYKVIYKLFEEVVEKLKILIPAEKVYTELGSVKVLAIFQKLVKGMVVGGAVSKGSVAVGATARVVRDDVVIAEGRINSLQAGKVDVKDVLEGQQCGIGFTGKAKIEEGDVLEIYTEEEHARTLEVPGA
ncbi:translation initiation factor IF-2, partial [Candidatus Uhrbacteria bacterium]|nr:translation initiation factor IF-2 [Candidatus Uhrbacteria bacterium]